MSVRVSCGSTSKDLNVVGKTVGEVRREQATVFNIEGSAVPMLDGRRVKESYRLRDRDKALEFTKTAGTKAGV